MAALVFGLNISSIAQTSARKTPARRGFDPYAPVKTPPATPLAEFGDFVPIKQRSLLDLKQTPYGRSLEYVGKNVDAAYATIKSDVGPLKDVKPDIWTIELAATGSSVSDYTHLKNDTSLDSSVIKSMGNRHADRETTEGSQIQYAIELPITNGAISDARLSVPTPKDIYNLANYETAPGADWSGPREVPIYRRGRPLYTVSEFLKLVKNTDDLSQAIRGVEFTYNAKEDLTGQNWAGETNASGHAGQWMRVKLILRDYRVIVYCVDVPQNSLFVWTSSFRPSTGNSPITVKENPQFKWERYSVKDVYYEENLPPKPISSDPNLAMWQRAEKDQGPQFIPFDPVNWNASPEQKKLAQEKAAQEAELEVRAEKKKLADIRAAEQERIAQILSRASLDKNSTASTADLSTVLLGKEVIPKIELGFTGVADSTKSDSPQPVNTWVYPNGKVAYRIELAFIKIDAQDVRVFKPDLIFSISKVEMKNDHLELKLDRDGEAKTSRTIKYFFAGGAKTRPTNGEVVNAVLSTLRFK